MGDYFRAYEKIVELLAGCKLGDVKKITIEIDGRLYNGYGRRLRGGVGLFFPTSEKESEVIFNQSTPAPDEEWHQWLTDAFLPNNPNENNTPPA